MLFIIYRRFTLDEDVSRHLCLSCTEKCCEIAPSTVTATKMTSEDTEQLPSCNTEGEMKVKLFLSQKGNRKGRQERLLTVLCLIRTDLGS